MLTNIEQAEALHQRYLAQRRNLDRIIDESQRRIDALIDARDDTEGAAYRRDRVGYIEFDLPKPGPVPTSGSATRTASSSA